MSDRSGPNQLAGLVALALLSGCQNPSTGPAPETTRVTDSPEWFVERARESGLEFLHFNGMSGEFFIPENMSPGIGVLDYDNDDDLDVYVVQGQMLGTNKTLAQALVPPSADQPLKGRLFRNDLTTGADGRRVLRFTDVTEPSGIDARVYGVGVAAADINNDGCTDLYLTNFGPNQLFRNNCDGTFTDLSTHSGIEATGWSVSASFLDYDRDGWLDLFVARYLDYTLDTNTDCAGPGGEEDYCNPSAYLPQKSHLFRNNGDATFSDVTAQALVSGEYGPALGVSTADFDGDGWIDIFVANDSEEDELWINQRDGTFRNTALLAGVALTVDGRAEASMGVDAGDFDNDGDEDLFVTVLRSEGHNLFVNDGSGTFDDRSAPSRLGPDSLRSTGFGAAWFDGDNDGWLDILTVNGTIIALEAQRQADVAFPQRQPKQLFRNLANGQFEDITDRAGAILARAQVGRGAAFSDLDNDGDVDVLVANDAGPTELLINEVGNRNHWVGLRLVGAGGRDMLGARVEVTLPDGSTLWRRARSDGSYASANDPRVLVGLGDATGQPTVRVHWPGGGVDAWSDVAIDRYTTLAEGTGSP